MKLFYSKFRRLWTMESDLHWAFGYIEGTTGTVSLFGKRILLSANVFISWLSELERGSFLLVVLLSLFGTLPGRWGLRRDRNGSGQRIPLFSMLLLMAMAGIYLFIEVQLRYRISFLPVFFILAASGTERIFNLFMPMPQPKRGRRSRA